MAQSDDQNGTAPDATTTDDASEAVPALPDQARRFSEHWLRMSAVLLSEIKRRDLMETPEAQAVIGARRQIIRKHRAGQASTGSPRQRKRRPETKWEAFLRKVGRKPRPGTGSGN